MTRPRLDEPYHGWCATCLRRYWRGGRDPEARAANASYELWRKRTHQPKDPRKTNQRRYARA